MPLLDKSRLEPKLGEYAVGSTDAIADPSLHPAVQDYRRRLSAQMLPLEREDIETKIPKSECFVSRKIDGEFTVLVFRDGAVFTINPGGAVRVGMPWLTEARALLERAGAREAQIAGELYVQSLTADRPRVHDVVSVARNPQSQEELNRMRFAAFDVISWNGEAPGVAFGPRWEIIQQAFGEGERVHPVETHQTKDQKEISKLFAKWVDDEGAEGAVVRSDQGGMYKIKQRHTIDAAVLGFTESIGERQGMLHDLLVGVVRPDGALHVLTRVGGGFSEDLRREMLSDLKDMAAQSDYAEVNADHVAYQMVEPEWVVEISCLDLVSQNTRGGPIQRMTLDWDHDSHVYKPLRRLPLASVISPQFIRRREDKQVSPDDVRIAQVADLVDVPLVERSARAATLPESQLLRREVYTKDLKGQTMVRKFLVWKTNKETESDVFPAYVLHLTDFSPGRKAPLAREVRISSSHEQIVSLFHQMKEENVKRGWNFHSALGPAEVTAPAPTPAEIAAPPVLVAAAPAAEAPAAVEAAAAETAAPKKAAKKPAAKKPAAAKKAAPKEAAPKKPAKKTAMAESGRKKKKKGDEEKRA
jgi:hypothetical protein